VPLCATIFSLWLYLNFSARSVTAGIPTTHPLSTTHWVDIKYLLTLKTRGGVRMEETVGRHGNKQWAAIENWQIKMRWQSEKQPGEI